MRDYLNIGSSPTDEPCAQLGTPNYAAQSMLECLAFKHQLQRLWPSGHFTLKWFDHDFGTYCEVVAWFDDTLSDDSPMNLAAYAAESQTPQHWDPLARAELAAAR